MQSATAYWRHRAETYGPGWAQHYWDSYQAPHRQVLRSAVASCAPFSSILEVGAACGPNLRLWRLEWAHATLLGVDVSREMIRFGKDRFEGDVNVHLWVEDYLTAPFLPMADLVVSCYALAYCDPAGLPMVLDKIWKSARKAVILAEPMALDGLPVGPCKDDMEEWRHDYHMALADLGARIFEVRPVSPPAELLNGILVARKES